jgi:hypothetical protein
MSPNGNGLKITVTSLTIVGFIFGAGVVWAELEAQDKRISTLETAMNQRLGNIESDMRDLRNYFMPPRDYGPR